MKYIQHCTLFLAVLVTGCSGDNAENAAAGAASKAVELAKGAMTGVEKGVKEGRKASNSADGALVVSSGKELQSALHGEVLHLDSVPGASSAVTLGFSNAADAPVRVTGLAMGGHVTALDDDGYACKTVSAINEFTVPAKAKLKVDFAFDCGNKRIAMVRLFDAQYPSETRGTM